MYSMSVSRIARGSTPNARSFVALLLLSVTGLLTACGSGSSSSSGGGTAPTLSSIAVTATPASVALGNTSQLSAVGTYSDGSTQTITSSVTWSSATTTVATISSAGLASTVAVGSTVITATSGTVSGTATLTVTAAAVKSIAVTPATPSIAKGLTQQFVATATMTDGTTQVITTSSGTTWASGTTAVATVTTAGLATGVGAGTSVISATSSGVTGSTTLTVTAPTAPTLTSIAVTATPASVALGNTSQLSAVGTYSDGSTQTITSSVTWSSATTSVATISATGLATSVAVGTTVITATLGTVSGTATLTVTAATLVSIAITPTAPTVPAESTIQLTITGTYSDRTTAVLTGATAAWTSATAAVATINASTGLATGVAPGTSAIDVSISAPVALTAPAVTLTVTAAEYAFVTNIEANTVSVFTVGPGGALAANGSPVATGSQPYGLAIDTSKTYLFVSNYAKNTVGSISEYTISPSGALTLLATVTSGVDEGPSGMAVQGTNLYLTNYGKGTVSHYTIGAEGALTFDEAVNVATSNTSVAGPNAITINAAGTVAYVPNYLNDTVSVFSIDPTTGALTLTSTVTEPTQSGPVVVLIDPTSTYAYVGNFAKAAPATGNVAEYSIGADGALTALSPASVTVDGNVRWLALAPSGTAIYLPNSAASTLQTLSIGTGGLLTLESATTALPAGANPAFVAVDPSNQYVYVANRGGGPFGTSANLATYNTSVSQFSVGPDSALTALSPATATAQLGPTWILMTTAN